MSYFDIDLFRKIVKILNASGKSIMKEIVPLLNCTESPLYPPDEYQTIEEKSAYLQRKNDKVLIRIQEICKKYDRKKLLFTTRMMPFAYVNTLNKHADLEEQDVFTNYAFIVNGTMLATKAILHFSHFQDNAKIDYDEFISDSFRLIVLSLIRFTLNSANLGLRIYDDEDYTILGEMRKQEVKRPIFWPAGDAIPQVDNKYLPVLIPSALVSEDAIVRTKLVDEEEFKEFPLYNFIPFFADLDEYLVNYKWLNDSKFVDDHQISFDKYCEYFNCLTKFVISKLIFKDDEQKVIIKNDAEVYKLISYVGITGCGLLEIKEKELFQHFKKHFSDKLCLKEYKNFIDSLMIDEHECSMLDIDILEHPYIFYRFDKKMLVWDFLQNPIIWKCFSRQASDGGQDGNVKGKAFEEYVYHRLCNVNRIEGIKRNIAIYSDKHKKLMDIDIGFVRNEILYLVELKSYIRKKGEISGLFYKGMRLVKQLKNYDELLAKHRDKIYNEWSEFKISDAVYLLVTADYQFIEVKDESLWIIWGEMPRICVADELILYLDSLNYHENP